MYTRRAKTAVRKRSSPILAAGVAPSRMPRPAAEQPFTMLTCREWQLVGWAVKLKRERELNQACGASSSHENAPVGTGAAWPSSGGGGTVAVQAASRTNLSCTQGDCMGSTTQSMPLPSSGCWGVLPATGTAITPNFSMLTDKHETVMLCHVHESCWP